MTYVSSPWQRVDRSHNTTICALGAGNRRPDAQAGYGQLQTFGVAVQIARNWSSAVVLFGPPHFAGNNDVRTERQPIWDHQRCQFASDVGHAFSFE
jgi:hypothetical protein